MYLLDDKKAMDTWDKTSSRTINKVYAEHKQHEINERVKATESIRQACN